jgi:hypothetical protein
VAEGASGGQGGIRTRETVSRLHAFQACAFSHSATCPAALVYWRTLFISIGSARSGFGGLLLGPLLPKNEIEVTRVDDEPHRLPGNEDRILDMDGVG